MNKKKAAIESLAAQEPLRKASKTDDNQQNALDIKSSQFSATKVTPVVAENGDSISVQSGIEDLENGELKSCNSSKNRHRDENYKVFHESTTRELRKYYAEFSDYYDELSGVNLNCIPFRHCVLPNFVTDQNLMRDLELTIKELHFNSKNNDLYKFSQSCELIESKSLAISAFRDHLEQMRDFLSSVTGVDLNSKIDLFCSRYKYTDVLLCHDDELEERRFAFIYYLVSEDWGSSHGGTLDLFDSDDLGQPKSIVKSIVPKRNNFVFFEVSAKSFHQVAEVICQDKTRLSLSGWFHGPPLPRPDPHIESLPPAIPYGSIEESVFYSWFNPMYLAPEVQQDIRRKFEENSEIELTSFLEEEPYKALLAALTDSELSWKLRGPVNKRNYFTPESVDLLPRVVREFQTVLQSDAFFLVLSNLTGLKLHPLAASDDDEVKENGETSSGESSSSLANGESGNPRCRGELRKWEHGCYTLAHDLDSEIQEFALDTMLFVGSDEDWNFETGGYTSYIAKGEDEELLSVLPVSNSIALVYRDKGTVSFVKHLNRRVTERALPRFFQFNTVYYE